MGRKKKEPVRPTFKDEDEEFEFWSTHDTTPYIVDTSEEELGKLLSFNPITYRAFLAQKKRREEREAEKTVKSDRKR